MRTASFSTARGPGRIQISRGAPRRHPAGYRQARLLAPGPWFGSVAADEYVRRYRDILDGLDPQVTWDLLHRLAGQDVEPVLLCFERAPFSSTNWCHRRIVAEWFERTLGHDVPEDEGDSRPMSEILGFDIWR